MYPGYLCTCLSLCQSGVAWRTTRVMSLIVHPMRRIVGDGRHTPSGGGESPHNRHNHCFARNPVALGATGGFTPFGNLLLVTVRTLNGNACRYGPLLGERWCREVAHADIDFSPSPR